MHTRNGRAARDIRRNEAALRQAGREGITDQQQIDKLIKAGHSHCREVHRLRHRVAAANGEYYHLAKGDKDAKGND